MAREACPRDAGSPDSGWLRKMRVRVPASKFCEIRLVRREMLARCALSLGG